MARDVETKRGLNTVKIRMKCVASLCVVPHT